MYFVILLVIYVNDLRGLKESSMSKSISRPVLFGYRELYEGGN